MTSGDRCVGRDGHVRLFIWGQKETVFVCFHYLDLVMIS